MTDFIRPELRARFWRWREVGAGAGLIVLGLWWRLVSGGLLGYLGYAVLGVGAMLVFLGVQRGRFRGASGGVGAVDVDEGQVTYYGPLTGGMMPLREMDSLILARTAQSPHWRLSAGQTHLHIPIDADGSDALFDAFASLPGLNTERMLKALNDPKALDTVIWQRNSATPPLLHS